MVSSGYTQFLLVNAVNFGKEASIIVDPMMVDPAVTEPEEEYVTAIITPVTPVQYWMALSQPPQTTPASTPPTAPAALTTMVHTTTFTRC